MKSRSGDLQELRSTRPQQKSGWLQRAPRYQAFGCLSGLQKPGISERAATTRFFAGASSSGDAAREESKALAEYGKEWIAQLKLAEPHLDGESQRLFRAQIRSREGAGLAADMLKRPPSTRRRRAGMPTS